MQAEYTGRQVSITPALRRIGDEGIERIAKLLPKIVGAHIVLTSEKYRKTADVSVKMRAGKIVGFAESTQMDQALREALERAETQAIRHQKRQQAIKRQPKEEKQQNEVLPPRSRKASRSQAEPEDNTVAEAIAEAKANGKRAGRTMVPVTVHTFPATRPIPEPHIVRSSDSVALRPMTIEEAVKEAEFRDRDVFVFRTNEGTVCVLHRKRDGKMELIEAP
ncbi:MAG TPA: ribosome-associated translation inhibitor RaiA [Acidobacteriaceae bacterium]|jgi:putative sigma-54 modulation protein|nr:ribosome-associated translation inhibitor RaiA [Acidobacteriaceae bacterium]